MPTYTWLNFEKVALHKVALKTCTYYHYLDDTFVVWPFGEKAFYGLFDSLNNHEPFNDLKLHLLSRKLISWIQPYLKIQKMKMDY